MFTLFNLQGTLAVSEVLFRTSPLIIAFCQPLVKYFFQSFSSFSDFFLSRPPRAEKNRGLLKTSVLALRIFPVSHPTSIVRANELNFCVRDGNRWTLAAINTNYFFSGCTLKTEHQWFLLCNLLEVLSLLFLLCRSSPRLISIGQLNVLPHLHLRPINDIVYVEPYSISGWEILS